MGLHMMEAPDAPSQQGPSVNESPLGLQDNTLRKRVGADDDSFMPVSPISPTAASEPAPAKPAGQSRVGFPYDSEGKPSDSFVVPYSPNCVEKCLKPQFWSWPTMLMLLGLVYQVYLTLFGNLPVWMHVASTLFWRCGYDVFLGFLLRQQSNTKMVTRIYTRLASKEDNSFIARLLRNVARQGMPKGYKATDYPDCLNSWLVYRHIVDVILFYDVFNYIFLAYKCWDIPSFSQITPLTVVLYILGVFLLGFNYWAKIDAHRCIGDYCWYWGDFFFRMPQNLVFDGIFEFFPHPMYTVGYSMYYGLACISRSYTVLFVALTCHLMQLAFLVAVENPHIAKIYGEDSKKLDPKQEQILYDAKTGLFPAKKEPMLFLRLDPFRSADLALIIIASYGLLSTLLPANPVWAVVQVISWRLFHWFGLGGVLWKQARDGFWTRHFAAKGRTINEAFDHWKRIYNISITVNLVVFIGCCLRYYTLPTSWVDPWFAAANVLGIVLILINVWSSLSAYEAVGEFGWFYGDFFIPKEYFQRELCYTGIYRFLNNPDCVTGYAGLLGLSLMSQSWTMFFLELFAQGLNFVFLYVVEIPYMQRLYQHGRRHRTPITKAISTNLAKEVKLIQKKAVQEVNNFWQFTKTHVRTASQANLASFGQEQAAAQGQPDNSDKRE